METSIPLRGSPTLSTGFGGKGISDRLSNVGEINSSRVQVYEIDMTLLADEDLSGNWWKRNDPPDELIWTDEDRSRVREISCQDYVEKLESVLQSLRVQFVEEQKSDAAGLAPEVFVPAVGPVPPPQPADTKSRYRPQLSVSLFANTRGVAELGSPSTPGSTNSRSTTGSPSSTGSMKSKQRLTPKREFTMSPYSSYQPFIPHNRTPASPPTDTKKMGFWYKRTNVR